MEPLHCLSGGCCHCWLSHFPQLLIVDAFRIQRSRRTDQILTNAWFDSKVKQIHRIPARMKIPLAKNVETYRTLNAKFNFGNLEKRKILANSLSFQKSDHLKIQLNYGKKNEPDNMKIKIAL